MRVSKRKGRGLSQIKLERVLLLAYFILILKNLYYIHPWNRGHLKHCHFAIGIGPVLYILSCLSFWYQVQLPLKELTLSITGSLLSDFPNNNNDHNKILFLLEGCCYWGSLLNWTLQ